MSPERLYQHLEELLRRLGVPVRPEVFDAHLFGDLSSKGGLCRLRGRSVVLVDAAAPLVERLAVLASAAATLDTESVFVLPAVREVIEAHRSRRAPAAPSAPRLRLLLFEDDDMTRR